MKKFVQLILIFILFSCDSNTPQNNEIEEIREKGELIDDWTFKFFMELPNQNTFRLWVPENTTVKAILVLATGGAGNGTGLVNSHEWQEYARKEKLALLGVHVNSDLSVASSNLLFALNKITKARNLEYIASLPVLLRGFSHGGRFSHEFASNYKEKTIAYASIKGSIGVTISKLPPGLLITGSEDLPSRNQSIIKAFLSLRKVKAFTCFAEEPNIGHNTGNSDALIRAFFTAVLNKRLKNSELIALDESNYLLGNNATFQYSEYNIYTQNIEKASCLLDEEFAVTWQNFNK